MSNPSSSETLERITRLIATGGTFTMTYVADADVWLAIAKRDGDSSKVGVGDAPYKAVNMALDKADSPRIPEFTIESYKGEPNELRGA